jgi:hypothetical protein
MHKKALEIESIFHLLMNPSIDLISMNLNISFLFWTDAILAKQCFDKYVKNHPYHCDCHLAGMFKIGSQTS